MQIHTQSAALHHSARASTRAGRGSFYVVMGLVAVAVVVVGFAPGIVATPTKRYAGPSPLVWLHSLVFACWLLLYLAQTLLVRAGNRKFHRRLGWMGVPTAVAMIIVGYTVTIAQGRRGFALWWDPETKVDALAALVHPLGDLLTFTVLVGAAFVWRRQTAIHKRLMLLATVGSLMAAPVTHILNYFPALREVPPVILLPLAALYFASAIYDRIAHGRVHPVSLWGGITLFAFAFVRAAVIGPSALWHQFASWLIR
jgi:uncharacterized membrane protein YozB (DUF420 family)